MQDFPKLFAKEMGSETRIGFTSFEKWLSFSPAKNNLEAGAKGISSGVPPATASSAEMEFYRSHALKLKAAGAQVQDGEITTFAAIPLESGPRVILSPSLALTTTELRSKLVGSSVKVSGRSTLVLDGEHIKVKSLDLDGTLVVKTGPKSRVTIENASIRNDGWRLAEAAADAVEEEEIRGFHVVKVNGLVVDLSDKEGDFLVSGAGEVKKI